MMTSCGFDGCTDCTDAVPPCKNDSTHERVELTSKDRYLTDNGPPCKCQAKFWVYMVEGGEKSRFWVTGQCAACHSAVFYHFDHANGVPNIDNVKSAHYAHIERR